jgi:hypothetical protein
MSSLQQGEPQVAQYLIARVMGGPGFHSTVITTKVYTEGDPSFGELACALVSYPWASFNLRLLESVGRMKETESISVRHPFISVNTQILGSEVTLSG